MKISISFRICIGMLYVIMLLIYVIRNMNILLCDVWEYNARIDVTGFNEMYFLFEFESKLVCVYVYNSKILHEE
jgi:hypothetical protein